MISLWFFLQNLDKKHRTELELRRQILTQQHKEEELDMLREKYMYLGGLLDQEKIKIQTLKTMYEALEEELLNTQVFNELPVKFI